jgi:transcriptional regulator NrdR family protein
MPKSRSRGTLYECPNCGNLHTWVIQSRWRKPKKGLGYKWRRRQCGCCGFRFSTGEFYYE